MRPCFVITLLRQSAGFVFSTVTLTCTLHYITFGKQMLLS
uniref:Uncharacterized protein n=1 Tax=Anguilla anguilla TaxID=7936 RepID=A0A0E9R043_ANGAN